MNRYSYLSKSTPKSTPILPCVFICMLSPSVNASPSYIYDYIGHKVHKKSFGGQGIHTIIATPPSSCPSLHFIDATIKLSKKRYGKASVLGKPKNRCKNKKRCVIKVKWSHKAAGIVEYNLQIKWKKTGDKCQ